MAKEKIIALQGRLQKISDVLEDSHKDVVRYAQNLIDELKRKHDLHMAEVNSLVQLGEKQNGHDEYLRFELLYENIRTIIEVLEKTAEDFQNLGVKGYTPHFAAVLK